MTFSTLCGGHIQLVDERARSVRATDQLRRCSYERTLCHHVELIDYWTMAARGALCDVSDVRQASSSVAIATGRITRGLLQQLTALTPSG